MMMMMLKSLAAIVTLALLASPAMAEDKPVDLKPFEVIWQQCQGLITDGYENWSGWHNVFDNGYADSMEFSEGYDDVSAVVETQSIDAIAYVETTSCFRVTGELAMIKTSMSSPNTANGTEEYPAIVRHGEIYFDEAGGAVASLGWISDETGKRYPLTDTAHVLARGCNAVDRRPGVNDARNQVQSVLGDIEGNHPAYTPNMYEWCDTAKFPS